MARVVEAATVVPLRSCADGALEVLLGQAHVKNWLRSTPDETVLMRYGGELRLPGGAVDAGESLEACALRELREEFVGLVPPDARPVLRLFSVKRTKVIQNKSFLMHNHVLLADENPWLADADVGAVNARLAARERRCRALVRSGEFWELSPAERALASPEVHQVLWVPLESVGALYADESGFVNDWQREQFQLHGVPARDPMYQTMMTLLEIGSAGTLEGVRGRL